MTVILIVVQIVVLADGKPCTYYILLARMPLEGERSYIGIMRSANNWDRCQYNVAVHFRRDLLERILSFVV